MVAGEGDAGAPAPPAPILAEGEAGRRLMQGEGVVSSNSSSDGEGGSVHGGSPGPVDAGCFPYFSSVDEFNTYMKGAYW